MWHPLPLRPAFTPLPRLPAGTELAFVVNRETQMFVTDGFLFLSLVFFTHQTSLASGSTAGPAPPSVGAPGPWQEHQESRAHQSVFLSPPESRHLPGVLDVRSHTALSGWGDRRGEGNRKGGRLQGAPRADGRPVGDRWAGFQVTGRDGAEVGGGRERRRLRGSGGGGVPGAGAGVGAGDQGQRADSGGSAVAPREGRVR